MKKFNDLKFLADENINIAFVQKCRQLGLDVIHTSESGLNGKSDASILLHSINVGRVILTCDSDFGKIAFIEDVGAFGIIYLRPNHIESQHHLETIKQIISQDLECQPPFILVAERYDSVVRIRLRNNVK